MTELEARRIAKENSVIFAWVVWKDYSENDAIKASEYNDWLEIATAADDEIAIYEAGRQVA